MVASHVAAALLLASSALAVPAPDTAADSVIDIVGKQAFTLPQVATGHKVQRNGAGAKVKAFRKYGKTPSPELVAAASQQGSVTATPESYDEAYLCPVSIGTSAQKFNLDFDTGSSDLWVFSTQQRSTSGHNAYNPSKSSTSKKLSGYTWSISYGDGSGASGNVYADKVVVGGVTATSQAVEAATSVSSEFQQDPADGLLGLAFSSINTVKPKKQTTFFDTVKSTLTSPVFTADLRAGQPGSYGFGYIDSSKYSGSISYIGVDNSQGFWQFSGGSVSSEGSSLGSFGTAIADTGTTLVLIEDEILENYYSNVNGAQDSNTYGGWVFPCSASLPDASFRIGSASYTVPGSSINYAPADNTGNTCFGGLQSSSGVGINILGDVFLKNVFAVFDSNGPRLGFAKK